ncbi:MAG: phage tail tape measure protein [Chryseobacterium sp.]|nr:MAG: phage tail tape measure protein [Chryseobacterium sp.]
MGRFSTSGSYEIAYNFKINTAAARKEITDFGNFLKRFKIDPAGTTGFTIAQGRMTKAMRESLLESERLRQENTRLRNEYEQGRITAQQLAAQTRALNEQRRAEAAALREARRNQVAANGSYNEARQRLSAMRREIYEATNGFTQMGRAQNRSIEDYRRLNNQLSEFDRRMGNQRGSYGQSTLQGIQGMAATYLSGAAVLAAGRQVIQSNAEISDSLADVQRTTGLTAAEANNLSEQLKKIDTRTSLKGLLDIAIIGGQLGIAKDQLSGFTAAVDQLAVSLGGELQGGAAGIAKSLGVLDNVFKVTQENGGNVERAFNQIGSAILGLGQSGLATGDFLADFGERVGGLAKQAGLSLPVILSYGAVLQENGVSAEVAGTAFKRLLTALTTNRERFYAVAKIADADLTLKGFTKTINSDAKGALDLFFAGLAKGGTTTSNFNDILKSLKLTGGGVSQVVAALSGHQEDLNGHIRDATKDFDDATLSAEQFGIKNDTLAASIEKLGNRIVNITTNPDSNFSNFIKYMVDSIDNGITVLDRFIDKAKEAFKAGERAIYTRTGRTGSEFVSEQDVAGYFKEARERATAAYKQDIKDQGTVRGKTLASEARDEIELNRTIENQTRKLLSLAKERNVALAEKNALEADTDLGNGQIIKGIKVTKEQSQELNKLTANYSRQTFIVAQLNAEKRKLYPESKITEGENLNLGNSKAAATAKAEARKLESALTAQRALQFKIDELTQKGLDKQLDANEQEVAAVKMKYAKMIEEAIKFNSQGKNKALGLKVNTSGLVRAEKEEVNAVVYSQDTSRLKTMLDEQKKLYADFESFKENVGETAAKSRYAKLINTDRTYLAKLQEQYAITVAQGFASGFTGEVNNRLTFLNKAMKEETDLAEKKYQALLSSLVSYEQNKAVLIKKYETNRADAVKRGDLEAVTVLDKIHVEGLAKLEDENVQKLSAFKELFSGIDNLSADAARRVLGNAQDMLKALELKGIKISPELKKQIQEALKGAKGALEDRLPQNLNKIGSELQNLAGLVSDVNSGFGQWVSTLGGTISNIGQLKKTMDDFKDLKKGDTLGAIGLGAQALGIFSSITKGITNIIQSSYQKVYERRAADNEMQIKQSEAVSKALDRQLSLINKVYGTEKLTQYSQALKDIGSATDDVTKKLQGMYLNNGNADIDRIIGLFNSGTLEEKGFDRVTFNGLVKSGILKGINATDIEQLRKLIGTGALDATAERYAQQLVDLKDKGVDAANSIKESLTGTSFETLSDSIVDAITSGAASGSQNFENIMRKAIIESLKTKEYTAEIQKFYDDFTNASKTGLNDVKIAQLKAQYDKIIADGTKAANDLSKVTGVNLTGTTSKNSLTGGLTSASQDSINILAGYTARVNLQLIAVNNSILALGGGKAMIDMFNQGVQKLDMAVKTEANTRRTADNTERIKGVEAAVIQIAKNTSNTGSYNPLLSGSGQVGP